MGNITIFHGSPEIREKPVYGLGKKYNDYGQGFYCTQNIELAKEWACTEGKDGYVNQYEIDLDALSILNLSDDEYTILHWLALLVAYRRIRISTPVMKRGIQWLGKNFRIDIRSYDAVRGYRADDSYFSFARAFLNNEISLEQLSYAMRLGRLGEQFVLKSRKAFQIIRFLSYEPVSHKEYFFKRRTRDEQARAAYRAQLEQDDINGLYMRDIIREEVRPDDPRLQ